MKSSGLLPLALLVLVTLAPWAVEGARKASLKIGSCPERQRVLCLVYEKPECGGDWQCPGKKKCCQDICGVKCLDPVKLSDPVMKPGQCPEMHEQCMMNTRNQCETDSNCPRNLKCCSWNCRKICIVPKKGAPSKGGAQP